MTSVIIPVFNTESYLDKCIHSVFESGLKDFEIIIINDGSTDHSEDVVRKYLVEYPNICHYYRQENKGVSSARNLGLKISNGNLIMFLDSDDYLIKDSLINIDLIKNYEFCSFFQKNSHNTYETLFLNKDNIIEYISKILLGEENYSAPWSKIYKKDIIDRNKIEFNEQLPIGEDMLFNIEYLCNCSSIIEVNKKIYHQNKRNDSATASYIRHKEEIDIKFNMQLKSDLVKYTNFESTQYLVYDNIINSTVANIKNFKRKNTYCLDDIKKMCIKLNKEYDSLEATRNCSSNISFRKKRVYSLFIKRRVYLIYILLKVI